MFQLLSHRNLSLPFVAYFTIIASFLHQTIPGSPPIKVNNHCIFIEDRCYFVKEIQLPPGHEDLSLYLYLKVGDKWDLVLYVENHAVKFKGTYSNYYFDQIHTNFTHWFFKDDTDIKTREWTFGYENYVPFYPNYTKCISEKEEIHFELNGQKYSSGEISVVGYKSINLYCVIKHLRNKSIQYVWGSTSKIYDSAKWGIFEKKEKCTISLKQKFEDYFTKDDDGKRLECRISGVSVKVILNVEYAPIINVVEDELLRPMIGVILKCEADAKPSPLTTWQNFNTENIKFTKLNISQECKTYQCKSSNTINTTVLDYKFCKDKWLPKILYKTNHGDLLKKVGNPISLKVDYTSVIMEEWEWFFNDDQRLKGKEGYNITIKDSDFTENAKTNTLQISNLTVKHSGIYTFILNNGLGQDKLSIKITVLDNDYKYTEWQYILGVVVTVSVGVVAVVVVKHRRQRTRTFSNPDIDCFASEKRSPDLRSNHNRSRRPYVISMEVDRQSPRATFLAHSEIIPCMSVRCLSLLGVGCFGEVYRARVLSQQTRGASQIDCYVAVKFLKQTGSEAEDKFLRELQIHTHLPCHRNVIKCFGKTMVEGSIGMVLEYSPNGNLKELLKRTYNEALPRINRHDKSYCELLTYKCLKFAREITSGMAHITNYKLLHRDLAARNILLGENNVCKITDFGLARHVSTELDYVMSSNDLIPVRWLSPEALISRIYSEKSDVWSFGIILWEIIALGGTPYHNLKNGFQVKEALLSGYRMNVPKHCSQEISLMMESCWNESPSDRPSFTTLERELTHLLEFKGGYLNFSDYDTNIYSEMSPDVYREEVFSNFKSSGESLKIMDN